MESDEVKKMRDLEALRHIIAQWNSNRLDLFSLSEPNEVIMLLYIFVLDFSLSHANAGLEELPFLKTFSVLVANLYSFSWLLFQVRRPVTL